MKDEIQFETLAAIRAYAKDILRKTRKGDIRPSTAEHVVKNISKMHNLKDKLEVY